MQTSSAQCATPAQPGSVSLRGGSERLRKDKQENKAGSGWDADSDGERVPQPASRLFIL